MSVCEKKSFSLSEMVEHLNAMRVIAALCAEIASAHVARAWPGLVVLAGAHVVAGLLKVRSWFVPSPAETRRCECHASSFEGRKERSVEPVRFRNVQLESVTDWTDADEFADALLSLRVALGVARSSQSMGTEYVLSILDRWEKRNRRVLALARAWGSENLAESHEHKTADNQEASAQNQSSSDEETDCS